MRLPNHFTNSESSVPSKITWDFEPNYYRLPRNVSWDGAGEMNVIVENQEAKSELPDGETFTPIDGWEISLIPDIWNRELEKVLIYIGDTYVGRIEDRDKERQIYEALAGIVDHSVGKVTSGLLFTEDDQLGFCMNADIRPILRVDWDLVESETL